MAMSDELTSSSFSYRTILRTSSIIGGAQVINILISLVRMKVIAVLIGPAGVGIVGLFQNLMHAAGEVAGLGLGTAGTRRIAAAHAEGNREAVGRLRRSLFRATLALALVGALTFWVIGDWLAVLLGLDAATAQQAAWLSLGVGLMVVAASHGAVLTGMRRIGDLARVNVLVGATSTVFGVCVLLIWGTDALVAVVIAVPAATFMLNHFFVMRLGPAAGAGPSTAVMTRDWRDFLRKGIPFMLGGLVTLLGLLATRAILQDRLGPDALGQFHASYVIGMTYVGFVFGAMGVDYYPRLAAVISEPHAATRLINEQTEIALLLAGPAILALIGFAPWVMTLLYTSEFAPAAGILRWQLLADVMKVMSWPLGLVMVAAGAGKTFVACEAIGWGVLVFFTYVILPHAGVEGVGIAFLFMYAVYLPTVAWVARRRIDFRWTPMVRKLASAFALAAILVFLASSLNSLIGLIVGAILSVGTGCSALFWLAWITKGQGKLAILMPILRTMERWIGRTREK